MGSRSKVSFNPVVTTYYADNHSVMKGYWRNKEATDEIFVNNSSGRWMKTGDIAYVDDKDRFFIVDRLKELIKVKGSQVAPAELEALLLEHPQLADAAVVGIPLHGDEAPRAYVVVKESEKGKVNEAEVKNWLAKRVTSYKRLEGGVVFVDAIPKNPVSYALCFMIKLTGYSLARFYVGY